RRSLSTCLPPSGWPLKRGKGPVFGSGLQRFPDPATELDVFRLSSPAYSAYLPAYYGRVLSHKGQFLISWSDRTGAPQAFRVNLKTGEWLQLTDAKALDGSSLTLMPDERSFCYFDGPTLKRVDFSKLRAREIYSVPDDWQRCPGASVTDDGLYAMFGECRRDASRLRLVGMAKGTAGTIAGGPWVSSDLMGVLRQSRVR